MKLSVNGKIHEIEVRFKAVLGHGETGSVLKTANEVKQGFPMPRSGVGIDDEPLKN